MTTNEIVSDNELIAVFDGWTKVRNRFERWWTYVDEKTGDLHEASHSVKETEFKYHENWNLLMPVLKKAKEVIKRSDWDTLTLKQANSRLNAALYEVRNIDIDHAHYCLARFIEWYNQNKA